MLHSCGRILKKALKKGVRFFYKAFYTGFHAYTFYASCSCVISYYPLMIFLTCAHPEDRAFPIQHSIQSPCPSLYTGISFLKGSAACVIRFRAAFPFGSTCPYCTLAAIYTQKERDVLWATGTDTYRHLHLRVVF